MFDSCGFGPIADTAVFAHVSVLMGSCIGLDASRLVKSSRGLQARQSTQALFARWLSNPDSVQDLSFDERELINQWVDLRVCLRCAANSSGSTVTSQAICSRPLLAE